MTRLCWSIFDWLGDAVILPVLAASVTVGAGFGALTTFSPHSFERAGSLGYLVGMGGIEVFLTSESPVHFLLYGSILIGMGIGVLFGAVVERETRASTNGENTPEA